MHDDLLNYNDQMFTNAILKNIDIIKEEKVIERIFDMKYTSFILLMKNIPDEIFKHILGYKDIIFTKDYVGNIFLISNNNIKKYMLEDIDYYNVIMSAKPNKMKRVYFDIVDIEIKEEMLNYPERISINLYQKLISKMSIKDLDIISKNLSIPNYIQDNNQLSDYMKKYNCEQVLIDELVTKFNNHSRNPLFLFKINNKTSIELYTKFNIVLDAREEDGIIYFGKESIKKDIIDKINDKHIMKLIDKILSDNNDYDINEVFITVIKMYITFGFDNALKILDNKFTYMNNNSINEAAAINFIDERRQYRLENQDLFYSHDVIDKIKNAINTNDKEYLKNLFGTDNDDKLDGIINNLNNYINSNNLEGLMYYISHMIQSREENIKNEYLINYCNTYILNNPNNRYPLNYKELYDKFGDIDINNTHFDENGRPVINNLLNEFLLGNYKSNNSCVLRLIFNKQAFGLNDTISMVINNFNKIKKIIDKSNGKLSIKSILDVIDVCKVLLYNLEPNEQDMTLDTAAKILRSHEHCTEPKEEIFLRAKKLHVDRRKKVYASIPSVSGISKDGIKYKVLNFDYDGLISVGIDTGSCLKVGGKGEDFLRYCLTNPNAIIVGMWDNNNFYICPFIRNGNGIYGNGIDPKPKDEDACRILNALKECADDIIKESSDNEKIEFATVTDLHQEKFFANTDLKTIDINDYLILDETFYSDYHKPEMMTYIISSDVNYKKPEFYYPQEEYYQKRIPNYVYNMNSELDKERIKLLINSIRYEWIDFRNISQKEKNSLKRKYINLKVEDFSYIVGNKDWFIAISDDNIISCRLPYDERAKIEYYDAFNDIRTKYLDEGAKML